MAITTLNLTDSGSTSRTVINDNFTDLDTTKADLASPTFTGTPTLPTGTTAVTQSASDNSTKIATTAYADAQATLGASEWTYHSKVTFASEASKTFSGLDAHDFYRLVFNLYNVGTGVEQRMSVAVRLNGISGTAYISRVIQGASLSTLTGSPYNAYMTISLSGTSALDRLFGDTIISGKHISGLKGSTSNVFTLADNYNGLRGSLASDSNSVSSITIGHLDGFNAFGVENSLIGTVELWYKDSK